MENIDWYKKWPESLEKSLDNWKWYDIQDEVNKILWDEIFEKWDLVDKKMEGGIFHDENTLDGIKKYSLKKINWDIVDIQWHDNYFDTYKEVFNWLYLIYYKNDDRYSIVNSDWEIVIDDIVDYDIGNIFGNNWNIPWDNLDIAWTKWFYNFYNDSNWNIYILAKDWSVVDLWKKYFHVIAVNQYWVIKLEKKKKESFMSRFIWPKYDLINWKWTVVVPDYNGDWWWWYVDW